MAAKLGAVILEIEIAETIALAKAASLVRTNARDAIGNESNGYGWAALAESTIADKERKGYTAPAPLLRTGDMRDSIGITMGHRRAWVGSNDDVAVYQELGTNRIPPRSFIAKAAIESEDAIHEITVKTVGSAFAGHRAGGLVEALHAFKEGVDYVNEKIDQAQEDRK
jgi:phage gpG-like protein